MYTRATFLATLILFILGCSQPKKEVEQQAQKEEVYAPDIIDTSLLNEAKSYCLENDFALDFALLVDLAPHSGNYRMFAINLFTGDTLFKALCTHGHCQKYEGRFAEFSNLPGSNCSSLGKYKIGGKYAGTFGTSFKLYGLEESNSNALYRYVVLHGHPCVPDIDQEDDICTSEGCPTVSPSTLRKLETFIDLHNKPILLWIYS